MTNQLLSQLVDIASWALILAGSFFILIGAIGLIRMPDTFTRMHAASIIDTVGAGLLLTGMMLQAGLTLVTAKLVFILLLFLFTSPVVSHALAQAALAADVEPMLDEDRRGRSPPATAAADTGNGESREERAAAPAVTAQGKRPTGGGKTGGAR